MSAVRLMRRTAACRRQRTARCAVTKQGHFADQQTKHRTAKRQPSFALPIPRRAPPVRSGRRFSGCPIAALATIRKEVRPPSLRTTGKDGMRRFPNSPDGISARRHSNDRSDGPDVRRSDHSTVVRCRGRPPAAIRHSISHVSPARSRSSMQRIGLAARTSATCSATLRS